MRQFKDTAGRTWTINLTTPDIKAVKSLLNVDMLSIKDFVDSADQDFPMVVDVLFVLIRSEAEKLGITDIMFGRAMAGDCIEEASQALIDELIDYFPKKKREMWKNAWKKTGQVQSRLIDIETKNLETMDVEAEVQKILKKHSDLSTKSPEKSG